MFGATTSATYSSKPSIIQGQLSVITNTFEFVDSFFADLVELLDDVIDDASTRLEMEAAGDPDWQQYAENLDVELIEGEIHVYHTGSASEDYEMARLEYGDAGVAPKALLRTFAYSEAPKMEREINDRMSGMVPYA